MAIGLLIDIIELPTEEGPLIQVVKPRDDENNGTNSQDNTQGTAGIDKIQTLDGNKKIHSGDGDDKVNAVTVDDSVYVGILSLTAKTMIASDFFGGTDWCKYKEKSSPAIQEDFGDDTVPGANGKAQHNNQSQLFMLVLT